MTLIHTTVAGHPCMTQGGNGLYVEVYSGVTIQNSIFWDNGGDDFFVDGTSQITATYTIAEETLPGVGNLATDPLFVDPEPTRLSPAIHRWSLGSGRQQWQWWVGGGCEA